jgi:uroporphyrinogen decarboxylase
MTQKENLIRTITRNHPEWVPFRYDGCLTMLKPGVVARPDQGGLDDWGVNWLATNTREGSYPDGKPVAFLDRPETFRVPETDFALVTRGLKEQVEKCSGRDTLVIGYNELTLFERAELQLGTNDFLMATVLETEKLAIILERITDYQVELTESMLEAGLAGIRFTDDWGLQTSLFIAPEVWRLLIKPRLKRLYAVVKKRGAFVFQHSCGHIDEIVPDLIEIGLDILDPCQPQANDIFTWKTRYGSSLSFMGGLDTQSYLSLGSPQQVRERVAEVVKALSKGGGYIAAPSHTITIPKENKRAMVESLSEINGRTVELAMDW